MTKAYVALSGGKDSAAMAILLAQKGVDYEMVMSDTGWELPETYWILPRIARALNRKLHIVSNGTGYQHLHNYGYLLPSVVSRWCTRVLKQVSQDSFFKGVQPEIVYVGIRADEAHRTEGIKPRSGCGFQYGFPLVEHGLDKTAVLKLCAAEGLLSPAYNWRSNTSCFCCPFQRLSDWRGLFKHHPDLYALAEDWEEQSRLTKESLGLDNPVYTWKLGYKLSVLRRMEESQLKLLEDDDDEQACTICRW